MAPWRFNFSPWRFSKCRDASVSAVTLQEITNNIGIVLRCPAIQINVRSYSITLTYCIAAWQCVARLCACPVVIWCHMVRHCWRVYQRVAGCIRPANTIVSIVRVVRWRNVDLMLVHRLQRWLNIKARCSTCSVCRDNRAYAWCVTTILYRVYTNPTSTQRCLGNEACWLRSVGV